MDIQHKITFLQNQCTEAYNTLELHKSLLELIRNDEYKYVECNYRSFWHLVLRSTSLAAINIVSKLYDQQTSSQSMKSLLNLIKSKHYEFCPEKFRDRNPDKVQYPELAKRCEYPGDALVDQDIELFSCKDAVVKNFVVWRGNFYSHFSEEIILNASLLATKYPLSIENITMLINRCSEVLNKYERLYSATTYSRKVVGFDEHRHLLNQLRDSLNPQYERYHQKDNSLDAFGTGDL